MRNRRIHLFTVLSALACLILAALSVQSPLHAAADQSTQTSTTVPNAPWKGQMKLITVGDNAGKDLYIPPQNVAEQIGKDWGTITAKYIAFPKQLLTLDQQQQYFINPLPTPTGDVPTPTPAGTAASTYAVSAPLTRTTVIVACQANGAVCLVRDTWTSIVGLTFNAQGKIVSRQSYPGWYSDILSWLTWDATAKQWKMQGFQQNIKAGTPPAVFEIATATPPLVATAPAATDQAAQAATPVPDAPWKGEMKLITTGENAGKNLYIPPQSVAEQIGKDWSTIADKYLSYPQQLLTTSQAQQYVINTPTPTPVSGTVDTPTPVAAEPVTYDVPAPLTRTTVIIACQANGAECLVRDTWTSITDLTYDASGKIVKNTPYPGWYSDIAAWLTWDATAKKWKIAAWQMNTEKGTPPTSFMVATPQAQ